MLGQCFCGATRYRLNGPTRFASICHCQSCRRATGAPMVAWTAVDRADFELLEGQEVRGYHSSDAVEWRFCGRCGSTLFYESREAPEKVYVTVASLTSDLDRPLEGHVSFEEKAAWLDLSPDLPRYRGKTDELMNA